MLNKKVFVTMGVVFMIAASGALAADFALDGKPGQGGPDHSRPISWEELRERCAHPDQFDVQRAPQNIKIQCTDIRREWLASAPGEIPLPGSRNVITAVFADKFHVGASARDVPLFSKSGSCLRFKEVEKSLTIERPISCDEILGMKGTSDDFCLSALDAAKGANPKLIEIRDTGNMINTCRDAGQGNGK
ncbi:MAG: hypothetical protein A2428_02665 [Bdellovibrionales bacterium RIFOXYC1_FULL_54_43]|nr:MAG: hypothetical protein A2428_02665 [Bdellovibrionales bacterium RIFOXYC1_FULL_54_43]OFZ79548.1 MAG: hypothetical protein A2603_12965 [Bdellovibrionales bacterium RIFOXYD1_FULL_55_31]